MNLINRLVRLEKRLSEVSSSQKGFSLLEILVALTLIGMILGFVGTKVFDSLKEGQIKNAQIQMKGLAAPLSNFRRHCNFYPTTEQGLAALLQKPTVGRECKRYNPTGYLSADDVPLDPWDGEYFYESDGKSFKIWSAGPDGEENTDDDIFPDDKKRPKTEES